MAIVFVLLLLSALTTDLIGIHAMFGAFALGAIIPSDSKLAHDMTDRLEDVLVVLLLPTFFAFTGLRTRNWPRERAARMDAVRADHRGCVDRQVRRQFRGRAADGIELARCVCDRRADEHARTGGIDRA